MYDLGVRLKEFRKSRGWTQKQLAALIHRSAAAVGSYEQNAQTPPIDVLITLAALYHVSIEELLGLERNTSLTISGLTNQQLEIMKLLLDEFLSPSGTEEGLSEPQMLILNRIICYFFKN